MRLAHTYGSPTLALDAAYTTCRATRDFLFVDLAGIPPRPTERMLVKILQEPAGTYTIRSQMGWVFEVFARGGTIAEALTHFVARCVAWEASPPCLPH